MGKLSDLWKELASCNRDDRKKEIQAEINKLEAWCVEKGFAGIKEQTDWTKYVPKTKKTYRFGNTRDGGHYIPAGARMGKDRCICCRYNNHAWCEQGGQVAEEDMKGCFANI